MKHDFKLTIEKARTNAGGKAWFVATATTNEASDWLKIGDSIEIVYAVGSPFSLCEYRRHDRDVNEMAAFLAARSTMKISERPPEGALSLFQRHAGPNHVEYVAIRTKRGRLLREETQDRKKEKAPWSYSS